MAVKTKEEAARVLGGTVGDLRFYAVDGCVSSDLSQMATCLEHMDAGAFSHHVATWNNDFSNWVRDVLHDDQLASDLLKAANAEDAARMIRLRVHWLQKKAH